MTKESDLRSLSIVELKKLMESLGEKSYRADQLFDWIHNKQISDLSQMKNISASLKEKLRLQGYEIFETSLLLCRRSKLDETRKYLIKLKDDDIIESVFMKYEHGNSVCVSSQVGCRMGCRFCASTIDGLKRNLTAGEMLGQIYEIMKDTGERISNVVIMGSGEPLDNYENVVTFIRLLNSKEGLNMSQRNITLSTCGIVPMIKRLRDEDLKITLAISLHSPEDEKRKEIMPIASKYSLKELMEACRYYYEDNKRRITFEYSLIEGVNDSVEDAMKLSQLLRGLNAHVNLILVNPVKERDFVQPDKRKAFEFQNKLEKNHINVTIRRDLGRDIEGACGQLRRRYKESTNC